MQRARAVQIRPLARGGTVQKRTPLPCVRRSWIELSAGCPGRRRTLGRRIALPADTQTRTKWAVCYGWLPTKDRRPEVFAAVVFRACSDMLPSEARDQARDVHLVKRGSPDWSSSQAAEFLCQNRSPTIVSRFHRGFDLQCESLLSTTLTNNAAAKMQSWKRNLDCWKRISTMFGYSHDIMMMWKKWGAVIWPSKLCGRGIQQMRSSESLTIGHRI